MEQRADDVTGPRRVRPLRRLALLLGSPAHENGLNPALAGQVLLVAAGLPVGVAAPLLQTDTRGWGAFTGISTVMVVALLISLFVPWRRLPSGATLAFPLAVCGGLVGLAVLSPGLAAPLTSVLVLSFAYIGLAHPPGTALLLLPFAGATFVIANDGWTRVTSVRLVLIAMIWLLLAELLARQAARQAVLSAALRAAAHTDVLTGVGNRREVDSRLSAAPPGTTVVLCDLDHFKALNDTHGHLAGDRVLADFGALLRGGIRVVDFAGRFGGEEFLLVLPGVTDEQAASVLDRLHQEWARQHPEVTFSTGRATCRGDRSVQQTVASADVALYAAKAAGRDVDRSSTGVPAQVAVQH
jgi:diguanylate cyclase (GGDEF)-like protein